MITVHGKEGISATVIADSITMFGQRMTTFELVYPRFIHAELMTHRMLSKNAASSRAVPYAVNAELVTNKPAMPVYWGKNQPGMKAKEELEPFVIEGMKGVWKAALRAAISHTSVMNDSSVHKQIVNRLLEPWSMMKTVISGTEWNNFFWLRDHPDAQPEFAELAKRTREAMLHSTPNKLKCGEWHLPYVPYKHGEYWVDEETNVDLETAKIVSVSCCAQVSYRKLDESIEKARKIYDMLNIGSSTSPSHASPLEHQATPMMPPSYEEFKNIQHYVSTWENGITHTRRDGSLWSGNLQGWIQLRQLTLNEARW